MPRLAAVLLLLWFPTGLRAQENLPVVTTAKPVVRQVVESDSFVGRFEAVDSVDVRSRVGGYLDEVHFTDGAMVKTGDLLFTIDKRPYQAAYDSAKSRVDVATSVLEFATSQLERADALAKSGNLAISVLDDRRREHLSALAQLEGAKADLRNASLNLDFTEIRAAISGRIDRRLVSPGNLVQADSTLLTTIVSLDPIDFYFDIDERSAFAYARDARERGGSLQEGAGGLDVSVRLNDRDPVSFAGKLDFSENRLDSQTGTMRMRARLANADGIMQPGMFGRITMPGSLPYKGILVPDEAIGADQDRRVVYVVDETGTISAKPIRTGPILYGYRVVRTGLTGDETIVVDGLVRVRPGVKVKAEQVTLPAEAEVAELPR
ncbi:MexE family multidrug efflux RND transporter periplasmic adaptor subunit [Mesorhizobium sp. L-8-10]|uniref:efflux RND transporter periplasmic adaptor subunit n=1 Tax=unclassified Mesorhizobium TaxID=325217 RepID=UPI001927E6CF|nr:MULTISPECIES: efflux RND transporter periplasmic adaptor subunit [unclassified Mesorhizobium]BCH30843.1 MexE family multidrug efflux RND transporter periplasmic adaptor subunit [Mesorhizobium sp. L-8-10]